MVARLLLEGRGPPSTANILCQTNCTTSRTNGLKYAWCDAHVCLYHVHDVVMSSRRECGSDEFFLRCQRLRNNPRVPRGHRLPERAFCHPKVATADAPHPKRARTFRLNFSRSAPFPLYSNIDGVRGCASRNTSRSSASLRGGDASSTSITPKRM